MTRFVSRFVLASTMGLLAALGCSGTDSVSPGQNGNPSSNSASGKSGNGSDSSATPTPTPTPTGPLSNAPVASLTVTPHAAMVIAGNYVNLTAAPRDAKGQLVGRMAHWRSSNTGVAVVSDTGLVYGKAPGTATLYASIDNFIDSAQVTVTPGPTPASQFDLTLIVSGAVGASADTSNGNLGPIAGATVVLSQVAASGDSLTPGPTVGTALTDASGTAHFAHVAGGAYKLHVTPASGSAYSDVTFGFGPPMVGQVTMRVLLPRRP